LRILKSDQIVMGHADRVFRHSSARDVLAVIAILCVGAAIVASTWFGPLPLLVAGAALSFVTLFGFLAFRTYRRSTSSENWLLASDGTRLLIKLRSHLNTETAEDRYSVVEMTASDLAGFRVTESTTRGHSASGEPENVRSMFLDLLLSDDSADLAEAIRAERGRRPAGSVWRHYPVTLPDARVLRLEWRGKYARITPSIDEATSILRQFARVVESTAETIDLGTSGNKPVNADAERQLRLLASEGRIFDATVLAARTYGMSQSEARRLVDRLAPPSALPLPNENDESAV
jgi:hypothetical protein